MDFLKALFYGIVEGITEWLPISSTGHLILLDEIMPMKVSDRFLEMFNVVIQLGAILAVILLFFHKLNPFSPQKDAAGKKATWSLWFKVIVAVLPSVVLGLPLDDWLDDNLYHYVPVAIALIVYGVAFIWVERGNRDAGCGIREVDAIDYRTAILIGCFQCLALIPGTSRSGATILGAIFLGVSRSAAAEFSFFLAIPTMVGASGLKAVKFILDGAEMSNAEWGILAIGCVSAFLVSLAVIKALMEYVRKHSFSAFGYYRIVLGIVVLAYYIIGKLA